MALDGCQQAFGALETTEATWARGGGQAEGQLQWAPWPLGWGQPAWGPLGSRGPAPAGPPSWEGCPPAMVEGMGERGQAVVTGGGAFSLASLFLQPLRWTHPELGGPSPWKAVGGGGPLAPSYVPHPAHHTPHPAPPDPFAPQGMVTREALMTAQWQGHFLGVPRGVCSWVGYRSSSGGVCEGWHLGWGLGGESRDLPGLKRVFKRLWGH